MNYRGDVFGGCTIGGSFTTVTTTGAPTAIAATAGSLCVICYKLHPGETTGFSCSTAGITLATNCGGRTGWNVWSVDTGISPTFYSCGKDYELVLQGGTVGGTCVSGYQVAAFSIKNRAALLPIVNGRTLDVDASGRVLTQPCSTTFTVQKVIDRPIVDACSAIFSVRKLIDPPVIDPCSTIHSVTSVINNVPGVTAGVTVTTNNDKTGYALSAAAVDCVGFSTVPEPSNVPGWPMTFRTLLGWLGALATNCVTQTATRQSVCNRANSSTIASADITCTSTIVHRGNFA